MASKFFDEINKLLPKFYDIFADKSIDLVGRIHELLDEKGMSQNDLAKKLDKKPAEISKWLSGGHNITLKTVSKIEAALGEDLLIVSKAETLELPVLERETPKLDDCKMEQNNRQYRNRIIHENDNKGLMMALEL